jgi:hypothetical protein
MRCAKILMLWRLRKTEAYPLVFRVFSQPLERKGLVQIAAESCSSEVLLDLDGDLLGLARGELESSFFKFRGAEWIAGVG